MSEKKDPLEKSGNYMKHCTKCPNFSRGEDGKPSCSKIEGGGYGQLPVLVKEGMPCPVGKFGENEPLSSNQEPKPEPKQDEPHFIFSILSACKSATFHFDDGDLTWTKK